MKKKCKKLFIVHAVDTEGPLYESKLETIKRFNEIIKPKKQIKTIKELDLALNGKLFSNKINRKIEKNFHPHLLHYNKNWSELQTMLKKISKKKFRKSFKDSDGKGYKITWHCVDHVNYKKNPRRRSLGYGKIFDYYNNYIQKNKLDDDIQFHFHPMSIFNECNKNGFLFFRNDNIYQILTRRILEKKWFPSAFRAGFHSERQDLHDFLEQYIPFDLSNINKNKKGRYSKNNQIADFRYDWRRATDKWEIYNPDHDDYQSPGNCRRYIGRTLSIMDRTVAIDQKEINKAFERANLGKKTLLSVTNHDFRNMEFEINYFINMLKKSASKYPDVKFYYNTTSEGFRNVLNLNLPKKKRLSIQIKRVSKNKFEILTKTGKVFGPQPFLAMQLKNGRFIHDNLDFDLTNKKKWYYSLSSDSINLKDLKKIGVGASDISGYTCVTVLNL